MFDGQELRGSLEACFRRYPHYIEYDFERCFINPEPLEIEANTLRLEAQHLMIEIHNSPCRRIFKVIPKVRYYLNKDEVRLLVQERTIVSSKDAVNFLHKMYLYLKEEVERYLSSDNFYKLERLAANFGVKVKYTSKNYSYIVNSNTLVISKKSNPEKLVKLIEELDTNESTSLLKYMIMYVLGFNGCFIMGYNNKIIMLELGDVLEALIFAKPSVLFEKLEKLDGVNISSVSHEQKTYFVMEFYEKLYDWGINSMARYYIYNLTNSHPLGEYPKGIRFVIAHKHFLLYEPKGNFSFFYRNAWDADRANLNERFQAENKPLTNRALDFLVAAEWINRERNWKEIKAALRAKGCPAYKKVIYFQKHFGRMIVKRNSSKKGFNLDIFQGDFQKENYVILNPGYIEPLIKCGLYTDRKSYNLYMDSDGKIYFAEYRKAPKIIADSIYKFIEKEAWKHWMMNECKKWIQVGIRNFEENWHNNPNFTFEKVEECCDSCSELWMDEGQEVYVLQRYNMDPSFYVISRDEIMIKKLLSERSYNLNKLNIRYR